MCEALRDRGVETQIAATDAGGPGRLAVPVVLFPRQISEAFKYSGPLSRWLSKHVADFDCVHVHAVFSHAPLSAARWCRMQSVPYVVRPLGALEPWSLRQKPIRKRVALALFAKRMLERAAAVHYTTDRERRDSERALGLSNGIVIPLGVDLPPLQLERGSGGEVGRPYVLFLSRLHPKKGVELLIEAFAKVTRPHPLPPLPSGEGAADRPRERSSPDWQLVIAGTGDPAYEVSLRRQVESLGLSDRVRFVGWVDGPEKQQLLAEAGLFVLPSAQENFGIAALEAMAAGVPVAVSSEIDLSDEIEHAGAGWVFPRTIDGIAAALRAAWTSPEERRRRGDRGRELAGTRFQWPAIAARLVGLYEQITKARNES